MVNPPVGSVLISGAPLSPALSLEAPQESVVSGSPEELSLKVASCVSEQEDDGQHVIVALLTSNPII